MWLLCFRPNFSLNFKFFHRNFLLLEISNLFNFFLQSGLITDVENSWPVTLNFKPEFEPGALLTIVKLNFKFK